jgi:prevent-host-death family protein
MLDSNAKGLIAELEIELAAVRLGVPVLKPLDEHFRCDLAFDVAGRIWRVQCKWGRLSDDGAVVIVQTSGTRLSPAGYVRSPYTPTDVDLFGIYCGELNRCFLFPASLATGKHVQHLRLTPPRNHQRACITLAEDHVFDGAIAQLGERRHGMAEVVGSSPTSSTPPSEGPVTVGSNPFRDKLGYWMERVAAGEEVIITHRGRPRIRLSPAVALPVTPQPCACLAASSAAGGSSAASPRVSSSARSASSAASAPPTLSSRSASASSV